MQLLNRITIRYESPKQFQIVLNPYISLHLSILLGLLRNLIGRTRQSAEHLQDDIIFGD